MHEAAKESFEKSVLEEKHPYGIEHTVPPTWFAFHSSDHPQNLMAPGERRDYQGRFGAGHAESRPWVGRNPMAESIRIKQAFADAWYSYVHPLAGTSYGSVAVANYLLYFNEVEVIGEGAESELVLRYTHQGSESPSMFIANWLIRFQHPQTGVIIKYGQLLELDAVAAAGFVELLTQKLTISQSVNGKAEMDIGLFAQIRKIQVQASVDIVIT